MDWDRLPPRHIEDCRHRLIVEPEAGDGSAVCNLLVGAGLPPDDCRVPRDTCSACLRQFPPEGDCWNTVIASLVYTRSRRILESHAGVSEQSALLVQLADRAADHLVFAENVPAEGDPKVENRQAADSLWTILPAGKFRRRRRVRTWAVGVVSSPRRQPTLEATLDSLARAGWNAPHLFLDGTVRVPERFGGLPGVLRVGRVGCWPNYYLALAELLMRHPDVDAYLLVEDDALFYDGEVLREYLEQMLWPERRSCLISLYCPSLYSARNFGWRPWRAEWTLGALAMVFPRRVAQDFLLDASVCDHRWGRWHEEDGGMANTDIVIGRWARRKRIRIWYPTPSLVQHIGVTSTLDVNLEAAGERQADRWMGSIIRAKSARV
jgi:hypothetical protein